MGTWGAGIYENDSTRDYADGIINYFVNVIRDIMKWDYKLLHPSMTQSDILMCHIDLLIAICSKDNLYNALPDTAEIKKWKTKYLEVWEYCINDCDVENDYKTKRHSVINNRFNTLLALSKKKNKNHSYESHV